ncbi:MAG: S8 family serine peptidase [Flavobacteriales bacterium]
MKKWLYTLCMLLGTVALYAQPADNFNRASYRIPEGLKEGEDYLPGRIICKTADASVFSSPLIAAYLQSLGATAPEKMFRGAERPGKPFDAFGRRMADLSGIYRIDFSTSFPVGEVCEKLRISGAFEYVQPHFIVHPFSDLQVQLTPNDPQLSAQWYLNKIGAFNAWNTTTGDTSITIAITDGGQNWSNPDLGNYYVNYNDPVDGLDNDGDGWIDNASGWNTGDDNYDPTAYCGSCIHGTVVSGIAAARPNNNTGVAGVGYNCRFMPVKIANNSGQWIGGEAGIFYAAQQNVKIINCSWGSTFYSPVLDDVVQYAAVNKGCLVVASAGNGVPTATAPYYPATLENVLAVTGTDTADIKVGDAFSGASYYKTVDISAPGQNIYTTYGSGFANAGNGTSYAAPMVSAAAALTMHALPGITALQTEALLKYTSFAHDNLPQNLAYKGRIGKGRLDMNNAVLGNYLGPAFLFQQRSYTDNGDDLFAIGDTVRLTGTFFNILNTSGATTQGVLRSSSPWIQIIDSVFVLGSVPVFSNTNNNASPYSFRVLPGCPENTPIELEWAWKDGAYGDRQFFSCIVSQNYINITENKVHTSIGSRGRWGFMDEDALVGLGLKEENGFQYALTGSFFAGDGPTRVSDAWFSQAVVPFDNDFQAVVPAHVVPSAPGTFIAEGIMNDAAAGANALGLNVHYRAEAVNQLGLDKFVILHYTLENTGTDTLSNVFAGIGSYWNILNNHYYDYTNIAFYDTLRKMGYARNTMSNSKFAGLKLLSYDGATHYAFNPNGISGSVNILDGFTTAEKWNTLSGSLVRNQSTAGTAATLMGTGPFLIQPGGRVKLAFAVLIADSLSELRQYADSAQALYDSRWNHWTGSVSSDWHNAQNWSTASIPDSAHSVNIPNGTPHSPQVNGLAEALDLRIQNANTLRILDGGALRVKEQTHVNGSLYSTHGGQFIQGDHSNLSGSGTYRFRYSTTQPAEEFLAVPIQHTALTNFTSGISGQINANAFATSDGMNMLVDNCALPLFNASSPDGNVARYNNTDGSNCIFEGYEIRTSGSLLSGEGYKTRVQNGDSVVLTALPFNKGLSRTLGTSSGPNKGWQLLGNPYPSRISWNDFAVANTHVYGAAFYTNGRNTEIADTYTQSYIPPFKGFWIHGDTSQVTYTAAFSNVLRKSGLAYDTGSYTAPFVFGIDIRFKAPSGYADQARIYHDPASTTGFDTHRELRNVYTRAGTPDVYTQYSTAPERYTLLAVPQVNTLTTFPLGVRSSESGSFSFSFHSKGTLPDSLLTLFHDAQDNSYTGLNGNDSVSVLLNTPDNNSRFSLIFCRKPVFTAAPSDCQNSNGSIQMQATCGYPVQYVLLNAQGDTLAQNSLPGAGGTIGGLAQGSYQLHYGAGNYAQTQAISIGGNNPVTADFNAPSTAYINSTVFFTNNSTGGTSQLWDFGDGMLSVQASPTHTYLNNGNYAVTLIVQNASCADTIVKNILVYGFGLEEEQADDKLQIAYMNGRIVLNSGTGITNGALLLYDASGRTLQRVQNLYIPQGGSYTLPAAVAPGWYFVSLHADGKTRTAKVCVTNSK